MADCELEALFEGLGDELELPSTAPPGERFHFDATYVRQATAALEAVVPAASFLGGFDAIESVTRPYDVPVDELLHERDLVSALCTVPVDLAELPDEAWPTELHALPTW